MNLTIQKHEQTLTLAQVCEAIANGQLQAKIENGIYHIRRSDLRHFARLLDPAQPARLRPAELAS